VVDVIFLRHGSLVLLISERCQVGAGVDKVRAERLCQLTYEIAVQK
jgi:hypothetical protein